MTCLQPGAADIHQQLMDRSSRDFSAVSLQGKENLETRVPGAAGNPCQGPDRDGLRGCKLQDAQAPVMDGVGRDEMLGQRGGESRCPELGDQQQLHTGQLRGSSWQSTGQAYTKVGTHPTADGTERTDVSTDEVVGEGLQHIHIQQHDEREPVPATCGFSSSLCFAADGSEQEAMVEAEDGGEQVVDSQRQINNGGLQGEGEAPHWSLEPSGGPGDTTGRGGSAHPEPDLVIEVAGCRIRAHKAVLCARSEYFRARRSRQVVRVRGVGLPAMRALLDHAYGAQLRAPTVDGGEDVDPEGAAALLAAAHTLQMPGAARAAVRALREQLGVRTCGQLLALAKRQRVPELGELALGYMSDHYLEVLRDPAVYGRLSAAERELIVKRRESSGTGACRLVAAELSDVYERSGTGSRPASRESSRPQSPCSPERPPEPVEGGDAEARWLYTLEEDACEWRRLSRVPADAAFGVRGSAVCALHNYLFLAGGTRGRGSGARPSPRVFTFNPATGDWAEVRAMGQARSQLALVALDGLLYAVGGECVLGVERYDPRADRWRAVTPLPRGAFAVGPEAVACGGRLYLTGGSLSGRLLTYEPRRDEWEECPGSPGIGTGGRVAGLLYRPPWLYRLELDRELRALGFLRYNTAARLWDRLGLALGPGSALPTLTQPFRCALRGPSLYCVGRVSGLRLPMPGDPGDGAAAQDGGEQGYRALPGCPQAQGPLAPVFLTVPERPQERP
ncbi:kelch repeat and BTB domain-containing protein 11 [Hemitrygon akajei]|uniref:kelch repeat and BTB domain-containing protein 11 n=1 Tax=Hemitrygon akajei TaxID=2704970 RepID=UPI003BFA3170